ncbi:MAG: hypothetical protein QM523_07945 [Candidatus Pacebacteria bacterium]|nr:hypothetical protein [Candidatus Paceibacterota bacterium]
MSKIFKKRIPLSLQLAMIPFLACILLGVLITIYIDDRLEEEANRQAEQAVEKNMAIAWNELRNLGKRIHLEGEQLMVDDIVLNNDFEIPDRISKMMGGTITYFAGDTRVTTMLKNPMAVERLALSSPKTPPGQMFLRRKSPSVARLIFSAGPM